MKSHNFVDAKGRQISYSVLESILDESQESIKRNLRQEKEIPDNVHQWVKEMLHPDTQQIHVQEQRLELEEQLEVVEMELKLLSKLKELRDLKFKNDKNADKFRREKAEGKYSRKLDFSAFRPLRDPCIEGDG